VTQEDGGEREQLGGGEHSLATPSVDRTANMTSAAARRTPVAASVRHAPRDQ